MLIPLDHPLDGQIGAGTADDPRLIIELWMPVRTGNAWRLLMCRRVPDRGGFWQGVSGGVERTDPTLRHAALRELAEELQLTEFAEFIDLAQTYDFMSRSGKEHFRKHCYAVILHEGAGPDSITLSEEHDDCQLMTFEAAIKGARFPEYVIELEYLRDMLSARA